MKDKITPCLLVQYHHLFDDMPLSLLEYVKIIGRSVLIRCCTNWLGKDLQEKQEDLPKFYSAFFCSENQAFAKSVINQLAILQIKNHISVVTEQNIYFLIDLALSLDVNEDSDIPFPEKERALLKAFLVANSIIVEVQNKGLAHTEKEFKNKELYAVSLILSNQIAYDSINSRHLPTVTVAQLYRCVAFFKFAQITIPFHLRRFLEERHCNSWQEYIKAIGGPIFQVANSPDGKAILKVPNNDEYEKACFFLNFLTSTPSETRDEDLDFIRLRQRPLYRVGDDYIVISKLFFAEKLYNNLYFDFSAINESITQCIPEFKSFIGYHFTEKTLLYDILDKSFNKHVKRFRGEDFEQKGISGACDYYVRNGNKIYLFECKDLLISSRLKTSFDAVEITKTLNDRLVGSIEKPKAVRQLINNVCRVRNLQVVLDNCSHIRRGTIYPIIVTQDYSLTSSGVNYMINHWFCQELFTKDIVFKERVKPVVMIHIDDLIYMSYFCESKTMKFADILDRYILKALKNKMVASAVSYGSFSALMKDDIFHNNTIPKHFIDFTKDLFIEQEEANKCRTC